MLCFFWYFFFFKQKTAYEMRISDWSSDVCSSDLPDMAIAGDRLFLAVSLLQLRQVLDDDEGLQAVPGHVGKGILEDLQFPDRRELIQHQQEPVLVVLHAAAAVEFHLGSQPGQEIGRAHV